MVDHGNHHDRSNDKSGSKKEKKRRRVNNSDNPLALARGQLGKLKSVESIWFRRSLAGYGLFVEYYSNQPDGTVCHHFNKNTINNANANNNNNNKDTPIAAEGMAAVVAFQNEARGSANTNTAAGAGMSRAAKRRRRQRAKNNKNGNKMAAAAAAAAAATTTTEAAASKDSGDMVSGNNNNNNDSRILPSSLVGKNKNNLNHKGLLLSAWEKYEREAAASTAAASNQGAGFRSFLATMSRPLPLTFRLRTLVSPDTLSFGGGERQWQEHREQLDAVQKALRNLEFSSLVSPILTTEEFDSPSSSLLSVYQACEGTELSKSSLGVISKRFKDFIFKCSQSGTIARQELASMLPVQALVQTGHLKLSSRVIDMCASPGSKTLQALNANKKNNAKNCLPTRHLSRGVITLKYTS